MNYSKTEKVLRRGDRAALTFYKNIKLKTIEPQLRIRTNQKSIVVSKNPWSQAITPKQIDNLLKRLSDSPKILYNAIELQNKQNAAPSSNKFKLLKAFSAMSSRLNSDTNYNQSEIRGKKLPYVSTTKIESQISEVRLMKKIEARRKKYVEQYRKMLLGMKTINLDSDLPRIKYVEQNEACDRINLLHAGSKL